MATTNGDEEYQFNTMVRRYTAFISVLVCGMLGWYLVNVHTQLVELRHSLHDVVVKAALLERSAISCEKATDLQAKNVSVLEQRVKLLWLKLGLNKISPEEEQQ